MGNYSNIDQRKMYGCVWCHLDRGRMIGWLAGGMIKYRRLFKGGCCQKRNKIVGEWKRVHSNTRRCDVR